MAICSLADLGPPECLGGEGRGCAAHDRCRIIVLVSGPTALRNAMCFGSEYTIEKRFPLGEVTSENSMAGVNTVANTRTTSVSTDAADASLAEGAVARAVRTDSPDLQSDGLVVMSCLLAQLACAILRVRRFENSDIDTRENGSRCSSTPRRGRSRAILDFWIWVFRLGR
jgi:hypothetical protein